MEEMLAGWLVAQRNNVNGRAARGKCTTVKRVEDRSLDRSGEVI